MTSRLLTPWWLARRADGARPVAAGGLAVTRTLDWGSAEVQALVTELALDGGPDSGSGPVLQRAHGLIGTRVRPVYAVNDCQPVSRTLARGRGSCSQRFAVLEAVARALGVPTRVRGLLLDGRFWYPRFPRLRFAVPDAVVMAWPEFLLDAGWMTVSELFGPVGSLGESGGFSNAGGETLFDAVARTAVDWDGVTRTPGTCATCDLSAAVIRDLGRYESRDDLFAQHGQTLCLPARTVAGPILSRGSAGAA